MGGIVGVIAARKESTRVRHKNMRLLGGAPLVVYTFRSAKAANLLDRVIVSTDDNDVRVLALEHGIEVPFFPRPAELCASKPETPTEKVLLHALLFLEERAAEIDALCLLQPTTPLRTDWEIDECVRLFREAGADTVFTVAPVKQRPEWMFTEWPGGRMMRYLGGEAGMETNVSQNLEELWYPTGGVYVISAATIRSFSIFGPKSYGVPVPWQAAIDIEEERDLWVAGKILEMLKNEGDG